MTQLTQQPQVIVTGAFDDIRTPDVRFLDAASRSGELQILLYSDQYLKTLNGNDPKFPESERRYFLESMRFVEKVELMDDFNESIFASFINQLKNNNGSSIFWAIKENEQDAWKKSFCEKNQIQCSVITAQEMVGYPQLPEQEQESSHKKVIVTGSFDWMHSGHIRFFEEASELGDLYVVVGHDANIKLLKGEGHPLFNQDERRYLVQSVRFVKNAFISSGNGWMDAEPEIAWIKPDIYVVNEDGDKPEKQEFCQSHGIEYKVLKRLPKPGLPRRASTNLRGF